MATIQMQCPGCDLTLELDAGFAGGVCRCSTCGTLMTVPRDSHSSAERLQRPSAPGAATARPEAPGASATTAQADEQAADTSEQVTESESGAEQADESEAAVPSTETLTTDSGRTVQIQRDAAIPTARRRTRPLVRAATTAMILLVFAGIVGLTVFALITASGDNESIDANGTTTYERTLGFDPDANVYTLDEANALGVPLTGRCAVIVDASGNTRGWLWLVNEAVRAGLTGSGDGVEAGLIYATKTDGPQSFQTSPQPPAEIDRSQIEQFQQDIAWGSVAPLPPAIERALAWDAEQIVLITGKRLDSEQVDAIDQALAGREPGVRLDVVLIDVSDNAARRRAQSLAQRHGGRAVLLSASRLDRWHKQAERASAQ